MACWPGFGEFLVAWWSVFAYRISADAWWSADSDFAVGARLLVVGGNVGCCGERLSDAVVVCVDCVHRVGCVLVVMLRFGAAVWCGAGMFGGLGWRRAS